MERGRGKRKRVRGKREREREYEKNERMLQYYFVIAYLESLKPVYIHTGITQHSLTSGCKMTNNYSTAWFYAFFLSILSKDRNIPSLTRPQEPFNILV